jgi:hypothetical protein
MKAQQQEIKMMKMQTGHVITADVKEVKGRSISFVNEDGRLEAHPSGLYAGLVGELVARMQQQKRLDDTK